MSKRHKPKPKNAALVCALADSPMAAVGSSFDHFCAKCKRRVMVSPSGQAEMKRRQMDVFCTGCAPAGWLLKPFGITGTLERVRHECATAPLPLDSVTTRREIATALRIADLTADVFELKLSEALSVWISLRKTRAFLEAEIEKARELKS
jgi:hypothetical protein